MFKKLAVIMIMVLMPIGLIACDPTSDSADESGDGSSAVSGASDSDLKRYSVESGMVEYVLSGAQTGTKTIYWDNWGMREATYTDAQITAAGMTIPSKTVSIMDGDWMYTYNPDDRTGTKIENTLLKDMAADSREDDLGELGLRMLKGMGGVKIGTKDIAGKTCDVYEIKNMNSETCVWKAVTLEAEAGLAGMIINELATKIEVGSVDEDKLTLPDDIEIKDMGNLQDMMKNL